jgi:hypothetical protein
MRALLGAATDPPFDAVMGTLSEILVAAEVMMYMAGREVGEGGMDFDADRERRNKAYQMKEDDEISQKMEKAVADLQKLCGPFLEQRRPAT